jgi:hypothetical protein
MKLQALWKFRWPRRNRAPRLPACSNAEAVDVPDAAADAAKALGEGSAPAITKLPEELLWLLDAPLFIDEQQVEAFYDAIIRPDYEGASLTLSSSISFDTKVGADLTVGAAIPWFGKAEVTASAEAAAGRDRGRDVTLTPISNAYRHLLALAIHYATATPGRLVLARPADGHVFDAAEKDLATSWMGADYVGAVPRALVFLDLLPDSRFVPAALELTDGEVRVIADSLGQTLAGKGAREYPGSRATESEKDEYFKWFWDHFDDRQALLAVEQAVKDHPVAWIDFNVSLAGGDAPFLHLHLVARGKYETGVFAYNFITRGFNYGLRIVGTLKSGPDLNVLAVFER